MGILSVTNDSADDATKKEATPTYLSGESLTFPLITAVGTAAITMYAAIRGVEPTVQAVVVVSIICGILVTIWGVIDARAAATAAKRSLTSGDYFKRCVIGVLNTVILSAALWGTVAVAQAAYSTG